MNCPYTVLGIDPDADDAAIRARYLQLTREFSPERFPEQAARFREAYERIKDLDSRVNDRLFSMEPRETIESLMDDLRNHSLARRIPLDELLAIRSEDRK